MNKTVLLSVLLAISALPCFSQTNIRGGKTTATGPDSIKRNLALVVGISSYSQIDRLLYADDDAHLFSNYLIDQKICDKKDVTVLIDSVATKANFFKELRKLLDKTGEHDRVFIYFAGHGDVENDIESGFLLTYNCEPNNYPATDAIDISMLEKFVMAFTRKNTRVVLITDACRAGNLAGGMAGASSTINSLNKGFQNVIKILSCQPNQLSQEKNYPGGGHGVFTYHLIDGLSGLADKDNDQFISLRELDRYLDEVADETGQQQVPKTDGDPLTRISSFSPELKLALLARKENNNSVASVTKKRGGVDSSWLTNSWFISFNDHLRKNRLIQPEKNNAYQLIDDAIRAKQPSDMIQDMKLELAAVLEDEAQRFINTYLRGNLSTDQKEVLKQLVSARDYLVVIENIIGKNDLRYQEIHVKKLFFDAYYIFKKSEKKKYAEALAYLEEANKMLGNQAWICNAMGLFYDDLKYNQKAEEIYLKAAALAPQWSYPWNNLGMMYWVNRSYEKAIIAYNKALELDSTYGFAWNGIGNAYDDLERHEESIQAYQQAIRLNPFDVNPWIGLGNVLLEIKNMEEAEAAFRKAIAIDSMDAFPWNGLGNVFLEQKKYQEAKAAFYRSITIDSNFAFGWNNLGLVNENQGRYAHSIPYYQIAVSIDSAYADGWGNLGSVMIHLNRDKEAVAAYKKAVQLEPGFASYWNGLGIAYKSLYMYNEAKQALQEGLRHDQLNYFLLYNLGFVHKALEEYSEAYNCFKKIVDIKKDNESVRGELKELLQKMEK